MVANYSGQHTGLQVHVTDDRSRSYLALEHLPPALRKRLNEATLPIPPEVVLAYYQQMVRLQGRSPAEAERFVIEKLERTERTAAETLARERETWNLGEEIAASMKAAHQRRLGR